MQKQTINMTVIKLNKTTPHRKCCQNKSKPLINLKIKCTLTHPHTPTHHTHTQMSLLFLLSQNWPSSYRKCRTHTLCKHKLKHNNNRHNIDTHTYTIQYGEWAATERGDHSYLALLAVVASHLTRGYADFVGMHCKATDKQVCLSVNSLGISLHHGHIKMLLCAA